MSAQADPIVMRKAFRAAAPRDARHAASRWLGDFGAHGPLDIRSIRLLEEPETFVAVVTYSEMQIEASPRHFGEGAPLLKSA